MVDAALRIFERTASLGVFDSFLAAAALASGADALVSADHGFSSVSRLTHVVPGSAEFDRLLEGDALKSALNCHSHLSERADDTPRSRCFDGGMKPPELAERIIFDVSSRVEVDLTACGNWSAPASNRASTGTT